MTALGIQAWGLLLNGIRIGFWQNNVIESVEVIRILAHSYRLASTGNGSAIVFSRFTFCFCRTVVAAALCKLA